jgi:hypothetical protein
MATNKRDLRAYVRYDGTGRIIPGSLVLRRSKPKVGDWKEIQTYECCDGGGTFTTQIVFNSLPDQEVNPGLGFGIYCGLSEPSVIYFITYPVGTNTTQEIVDYLNVRFAGVATFTVVNSTTISTTFSNVIANSICPSGTLTIAPYYAV